MSLEAMWKEWLEAKWSRCACCDDGYESCTCTCTESAAKQKEIEAAVARIVGANIPDWCYEEETA